MDRSLSFISECKPSEFVLVFSLDAQLTDAGLHQVADAAAQTWDIFTCCVQLFFLTWKLAERHRVHACSVGLFSRRQGYCTFLLTRKRPAFCSEHLELINTQEGSNQEKKYIYIYISIVNVNKIMCCQP